MIALNLVGDSCAVAHLLDRLDWRTGVVMAGSPCGRADRVRALLAAWAGFWEHLCLRWPYKMPPE